MKGHFTFASESVTEGHPDKVADQISDAILDSIIAQDPNARVACETMVTTGLVMLAGEITSMANVDMPAIVRETIEGIGYTDPAFGFDGRSCSVVTSLGKQSPDISLGVTPDTEKGKEQGAGDQGLMFGYACDETPELMPMTISYAHKLVRALADARRSGELPFLRPDGKSQVTIEYQDYKPKRVDNVVISTQHSPEIGYNELREQVIEKVIKRVIPEQMRDDKTKYYINPTGRFVVGGPSGDCGLTGRKVIVDSYGGHGSHGGGAFSGKDPSKVDRSASYMARYIAKNIVAAGLASRCQVQIAYAIGMAEPVSVMVYDYGTGKVSNGEIAKAVRKVFPLKPAEIIRQLNLLRPIYKKTAAYGHFGREESEFTWEKRDKVDALLKVL